MKISNYIYLIAFLISFSCKNETTPVNTTETAEPQKSVSVAQKIAKAHGYDNWEKVTSIAFTFGGSIEDSQSGRSWVWHPKTNDVILTTKEDTIAYNRGSIDSLTRRTDGAFINDKFWALIPFQLVWDEGTTFSEETVKESPISKKQLNSITIIYGKEGGYTPGDAYDIFYNDNYIIQEWIYRRGNQQEPSLTNTFENYNDFNGIKIAQNHKILDSDRSILLRNIVVELEN